MCVCAHALMIARDVRAIDYRARSITGISNCRAGSKANNRAVASVPVRSNLSFVCSAFQRSRMQSTAARVRCHKVEMESDAETWRVGD